MNKWIVWTIGTMIGSTAGYLYWYYVGCYSGSCMITSSPVNSSLYGGLMGVLLVNVLMFLDQRRHKFIIKSHGSSAS